MRSVSERVTETETCFRGRSPFIEISGSKFETQSPEFERDLYDFGQDHGGIPRAAALLEYIFDC